MTSGNLYYVLKGELLRFDTEQASSRELGPPRLQVSDNDATPLTTTLEIWVKSIRMSRPGYSSSEMT